MGKGVGPAAVSAETPSGGIVGSVRSRAPAPGGRSAASRCVLPS